MTDLVPINNYYFNYPICLTPTAFEWECHSRIFDNLVSDLTLEKNWFDLYLTYPFFVSNNWPYKSNKSKDKVLKKYESF